jgi:hypothetical protein
MPRKLLKNGCGVFLYPQDRSEKSVHLIHAQSLFLGNTFYKNRVKRRFGVVMLWDATSWFPWLQIQVPIWQPVLVILQFAYLYWVITSLLQVLRVESLVPGWKLYWLAVVYLVPLLGPSIWLFSSTNPNQPRRKIKT